jgi:hypothetical protein
MTRSSDVPAISHEAAREFTGKSITPPAQSIIRASPMLSCNWLPRTRVVGFSLMLLLGSGWESLPGADLPSPPPQRPAAALARKSEIKLFVTAADAEQATKALKLDEHRPVKAVVCFFDTNTGELETNNLILRGRQMGDGPGDFTVKLRAIAGTTELSDAERAVKPELDP